MTTKRTISVYSVLTLLSILLLSFVNLTSGVKLSRLENFDTCGGEFSGYQYSITSPNYPHNYSENQDCVYKLHGSPFAKCDQIFHIQFLNFTLRSSKNCELDYLTIEDRSVFCGSVAGVRSYPSKNNTLTIRFHSDSGSDKGFKILITTLPCSNFQNQLTTQPPESVTKHPNIDYEKVYPVYRPNNVFTAEDIKPNKQLSSDSSKNNNDQNNYLETSPKITAYFYEAPNFDSESFDSFTELSDNNKSNNNNNNIEKLNLSLKPSTEILLPKSESAYYSNIQNLTSTKTKLIKSKSTNVVNNKSRNNEKLVVAYNSYGVPAGKPYAPLPGYSPAQIQTGEVSENERYNIDCDGKINIPTRIPLSEQTFDDPPVFNNNYPSSVALPGINLYPATNYGAPGSPIPPPPASNPPFIPSDNDYNNNDNNNGLVDHLLIPPRPNFDGNINFNNNNNNFIPSTNIESLPQFRQCCNNQYNFQKFLIVSPGFPSVSNSANYYDCFYKINPLPNACRLRLNFKYFNYGNDDPFCSNGYVEIDGRKYCGCKTGLSLVTKVINCTPKLIHVRYSGYPRTKFSGFVIEVTQEFPPAYNYPYLSRSKKSAENLTKTEILNITKESATDRVKRELGYSYPKPNIVFNERIPNHGEIGTIINGFVSNAACQTLNFVSWTLASKEVNLRGARCFWNNGNGQAPGLIVYPGNVNNGYLPPNNLPGIINSGLPSSKPNYPSSNPGYLPPVPNYPNINENIDVPPVSVISNPGLPPTNSPNANYPNSGIGIPSGSCKLVSVKEGIISSPFYPSAYQNNLNACYRFIRAPNQCKLQLSILDFDLENSLGCTKDFVIFGNQFTRYCGRSVAGSKTLLNFPRNDIIDIRFVTDSYGTGRGFNIAFTQVLCTIG
ncbi:serine/threonine-protein kinase pakG [Microplitis demolitor]|uniref:serine/threonine-protein kinase pakG n=1 Tax=Microplitis demolitor TaxID=69319 RepID=UPI0004CCB649|nr:serine/threonine-protein kinase pakG [Microplitis demolitor]